MIQKILLASDGSSHSERALLVAAHLAKRLPARLCVVTVTPYEPAYTVGAFAGSPPVAAPDAEEARFYRETAERLTNRLREEGLTDVAVRNPEGEPSLVILDEGREFGADLIVLGTRGSSESRPLLLGSVSNAVVNEATVPVLVVRGEPPTPPGGGLLDKLVVAVDGSPSAARAFELAAGLSAALDAPLRIVTAVPTMTGAPRTRGRTERLEAEALSGASALVRQYRELAGNAGVRDVATELLRGPPVDTILGYLGESPAHLLVVGSRGLSPIRKLILGSVSTALLHGASSMVLVVKPPARSRTRAPRGSS